MNRKIYIFENNNQCFQTTNALKNFLYYLKSKGKTGVIDFTYSNQFDSLHKHLSIKENLILDSVPTSLIKDNELNLREFIEESPNNALIELINSLGDLNTPISELCPNDLKITSLVKAILSNSDYIFLVDPQEGLKKENLQILKDCLTFESEEFNRKIFIQCKQQDYWLDISSKIISKDEFFKFHEKTNPFQNDEKVTPLFKVA